MPNSSSVGISGANSTRSLAVTASTRIFRSLISAMALAMAPHAIGVWLPSSDCTIGPPPANGTTTKLSPSASLSISIESEGVVPVPGEATLYLPGSFLNDVDQGRHRRRWKVWIDLPGIGRCAGLGHRDEILVDVEGNLAIERRVHHDARRGEKDGVAIARRTRGLAHAEIAASAGDVLDVELFAKFLRQFLRHQPCDDVGDASGRERHDDLDRLAGVLLGESRARNNERHCERYDADEPPHLWSLLGCLFSPGCCSRHWRQSGHICERLARLMQARDAAPLNLYQDATPVLAYPNRC